MTKPKPVVAGILAAVVPGLGHAYAGHRVRGAVWFVVPIVAVLAACFAPFASAASTLVAIVLVATLTYLGSIVDAVLAARRGGGEPSGALMVVFGVLAVVVVPVVIAFTVRALVVEAFKVPSGSMIPSIRVGEHFFADKVVYRRRDPQRGEVMVFRHPEHEEQAFVTRVIGLPGDTIEARGGHPWINGWEVPSCRIGKFLYDDAMESAAHEGELWVEFLDDAAYFVFLDGSAMGSDYQGPYRPDGFFVMGDNRNNSYDSRMWFGGQGGSVPRDGVRGQARWIWLGRKGDVAAPPVAPTPDLVAPLARCLAERPPRAKTTPPPTP